MSFLSVERLSKTHGSEAVVQDLSFELAAGQTLSILGRSGSGKTTLLKLLAGLTEPDAGEVRLRGVSLRGVPPQARNIIYLYQEPLLFPHLDVAENVAFGLRLRRCPAAEIRERVATMLQQLELPDHAHKRPNQLSGGQRQRVAFGRALIVSPALLLLDEPFASLDGETRVAMQKLFKTMARTYEITALFVTHELKEALSMGDRVAYMATGRLRVYRDRAEMIADPNTGLQREIDFWQHLESNSAAAQTER